MSTALSSAAGHTWPSESDSQDGTHRPTVWKRMISPGVRLAITLFAVQVILFELLRLLLYIRNRDLALGADVRTILAAFLFGLRSDMATVAYVTLPLMVFSKLASLRW